MPEVGGPKRPWIIFAAHTLVAPGRTIDLSPALGDFSKRAIRTKRALVGQSGLGGPKCPNLPTGHREPRSTVLSVADAIRGTETPESGEN
jgi:hypothetical protein